MKVTTGADFEPGHGWSGWIYLDTEKLPEHRSYLIGHLGFLPSRLAAISAAKCNARKLNP